MPSGISHPLTGFALLFSCVIFILMLAIEWLPFWVSHSFFMQDVGLMEEKAMATHSSTLAWKIPMDGGAGWAAVYGVAQSQTRLKQLSSSSKVNGRGQMVCDS